ncbi:MAG: hypothetical protein AABZ14_01260, partial [Candidatus Margulisiibacteriota bacterium]
HNLEASRLIELANISDDTGAAAAIGFLRTFRDNADKALILTEAIERAANATGHSVEDIDGMVRLTNTLILQHAKLAQDVLSLISVNKLSDFYKKLGSERLSGYIKFEKIVTQVVADARLMSDDSAQPGIVQHDDADARLRDDNVDQLVKLLSNALQNNLQVIWKDLDFNINLLSSQRIIELIAFNTEASVLELLYYLHTDKEKFTEELKEVAEIFREPLPLKIYIFLFNQKVLKMSNLND